MLLIVNLVKRKTIDDNIETSRTKLKVFTRLQTGHEPIKGSCPYQTEVTGIYIFFLNALHARYNICYTVAPEVQINSLLL